MSEQLKNIVIGTSLTGQSDGVVRSGAMIARAVGASSWLTHAFMPPAYASDLVDRTWFDMQAQAVHEGLQQQAQRTGLADLAGFKPDHLRPVVGSPTREIVELALEVQADLIVIGAEDRGTLERIFLGSTADGVVRKAHCPVLIVRCESAFPPTRVEIPVDLSPTSAKALRKGLSFLSQLGIELTETEVLFVLGPYEVAGSIHFTPQQVQRFAGEELRRFIQANRRGAAPRLARVRTGLPREEILGTLQERQADLVILGTHGRTGLERLALGSVAAEVMHRAHCNLLLIRPDAGTEKVDELPERPLESGDWTFVSDEVDSGECLSQAPGATSSSKPVR